MTALISAIGSALTAVIGWIGDVLSALFGAEGVLSELMPLLTISIGISLLMLGFRVVRGFIWGD